MFYIFLYYAVIPVLAALWSPVGKGLISWLSSDVFLCFCHFPI